MCCLISVNSNDMDEIKASGNKADYFSAVMAWVILLILCSLPLFIFCMVYVNLESLDDPKFLNNWGFIYNDLKRNTVYEASFHGVFMIRRIIYALILVQL